MKLIIKNKRSKNGLSMGNPIEGYNLTFSHTTVFKDDIVIDGTFWGVFKGRDKNMERIDSAIAELNEIKRFMIENPDFTAGTIEIVDEIE